MQQRMKSVRVRLGVVGGLVGVLVAAVGSASAKPNAKPGQGTEATPLPQKASKLDPVWVKGLTPTLPGGKGQLTPVAAAAVRGRPVLLVGAPGGRGLIAGTLAGPGARVSVAEVYARALPRWDRRHHAAITLPCEVVLLVSSAEAVAALLALATAPEAQRLRGAQALASSPRVAEALRAGGFRRVRCARSALAADLLAAALVF